MCAFPVTTPEDNPSYDAAQRGPHKPLWDDACDAEIENFLRYLTLWERKWYRPLRPPRRLNRYVGRFGLLAGGGSRYSHRLSPSRVTITTPSKLGALPAPPTILARETGSSRLELARAGTSAFLDDVDVE